MAGGTQRTAALDERALSDVVAAASSGQSAVVSHRLPFDRIGDLSELGGLSADVPQGWIRGVDGAVDPVSALRPQELGAVLPHERDAPTVTRIYHVQHRLRALTDAVFDNLEAVWPDGEAWIDRDAGLFVSSSGGVTPAHADRHHNLLLQLTGIKQIAVCVPGSRAHASAVARSVPSLHVDEMPADTQMIELRAGSALYMPPYTLHWVRSTQASVALSCGWSSSATIHAGEVHRANATLRRLGLPSQPVGSRSENVRVRAAHGARQIRSLVPAAKRHAGSR